MIPFLKKIGFWLLKLILGSFANKIYKDAADAAKSKAEAAKGYADSVEAGKDLEISMIRDNQAAEKAFKEKAAARPDDDPFGIRDYNKEGP